MLSVAIGTRWDWASASARVSVVCWTPVVPGRAPAVGWAVVLVPAAGWVVVPVPAAGCCGCAVSLVCCCWAASCCLRAWSICGPAMKNCQANRTTIDSTIARMKLRLLSFIGTDLLAFRVARKCGKAAL